MKVLLISPYPPERDGIGVYSAAIAAELSVQGHDVAVIAARQISAPRPEVVAALPILPTQTAPTVAAAVTAQPDVVHVQFAVAAYGTWILSLLRIMERLRGLGLPVVVTMHEITRDIESLRLVGRALYRRTAALADHVILHTTSAQHAYSLLGADLPPSSVIQHHRSELPPGTVDADTLRGRLGLGDDRVALAFGFIDVDKGLDDLVVAAGRLKAKGSLNGVKIVVAGDVRRRFGLFRIFELRDRYHLIKVKRAIAALGLESHVCFTGFVPADEVRAFFDLAAVAVLPYHRIEQSGVGSLAVSAGTPLLTSTVGELPSLSALEPFPPQDPVALAARLEGVLASGTRPCIDRSSGNLAEVVTRTADLYRFVSVRSGHARTATCLR